MESSDKLIIRRRMVCWDDEGHSCFEVSVPNGSYERILVSSSSRVRRTSGEEDRRVYRVATRLLRRHKMVGQEYRNNARKLD